MIQGMRQGMVATPAMQLTMRALQANQTELQELISEALATNPALEELKPQPQPYDEQEQRYREFSMESLSSKQTLADYLEEQIRQSGLPEKTKGAALAIIPWLNHHGFFTESPATVQQELNLDDKVFKQARRAIRDLDPAGVGAQDLRESLIFQLKRLGESQGLPMRLLRDYWDDLVKHHYARIAKALDIDEEAAELAAHRIARLNPDPGSGFSRAELHVITPDVIVEQDGNDFRVSLTQEANPQLVLSAEYREMMAEHADKPEVRQYLSACFREGREFIRALGDRKATLLKVAQAITNRQRIFFTNNGSAILPLKMEDIATDTQLHVSTVSRAVRGKYLQCSRGIYELRSFFSTAVGNSNSEELSAEAVKQKLRELIEAEDTAHPLSDARLEELLQQEKINVARRTIAKYREQLKILPASLRKRR